MTSTETVKGIFVGVDVGSLASKSVVIRDGEIVGQAIIPSQLNSEESGLAALDAALSTANIGRAQVNHIVSTGYGRITATYATKTVTEISCHARGANFLFPNVRTIIDIGGQDCKAIRVDPDGSVADFAMNDKCAAGTGRFLEVMAQALGVEPDELAAAALAADSAVTVSSMCTVFAESEVVGLIHRGESRARIARGLHEAIARRMLSTLRRVTAAPPLLFAGGGARNSALVALIAAGLDGELLTTPEPQIVGALGAALHGARDTI